MSTRELIEANFNRLKEDCNITHEINFSGYTNEDAFVDSIIYILSCNKIITTYDKLLEVVKHRMGTIRYYKGKTYYTHKTISFNAIYQKACEDSEE